MSSFLSHQREAVRISAASRFFIFMCVGFFVQSALCGEGDSTFALSATAGTEYFDVFRQRSEDADVTVFRKTNFASLSLWREQDSLSLSLADAKDYVGFSDRSSNLMGTAQRSSGGLNLSWNRNESLFQIGLSASLVPHHQSLEPGYALSLSVSPFGAFLRCSGTWERTPEVFATTLSYQADNLSLNELFRSTSESFSIVSQPFNDLSGALRFYDTDGKDNGVARGFSSSGDLKSFGMSISVAYLSTPLSSLMVEHTIDERRLSAVLESDGQSFGDLTAGTMENQSWRIGYRSLFWDVPAAISYTYERTTASTVGHVESWPLGGFVTSVVSNRLNFQLDGAYDLHTVDVVPEFQWKTSSWKLIGSFIHAITRSTTTHWQPLFLVFGFKDYTQDRLSLDWMHLVRVGFDVTVPLFTATVGVQFEQYIPIYLHYLSIPSVPHPGEPPAPAKPKASVDGGRRISITLRLD